jgi:hypothetical protein
MMLSVGLRFLIGMFARTLGRALVLTGVAVGLTLLTLNVGFYLGVDFLVIGGPEPATWDWETMGLIFATDLPLALLAAGATFGVRMLVRRRRAAPDR